MKEFYNRQINSTQSKTSRRQTQLKWKAGGGIEDREREREIKSVEWSDKTVELINAATLLPVRYLDTSRRNAIDMCIHIVIIIIIMGFCIYSETKSLSFVVVVCRRSRRAMSLRIVQVPTSFCLSLSLPFPSLPLFHWSSQSRLRFLLTLTGDNLKRRLNSKYHMELTNCPTNCASGRAQLEMCVLRKSERSCISCITVNLLK